MRSPTAVAVVLAAVSVVIGVGFVVRGHAEGMVPVDEDRVVRVTSLVGSPVDGRGDTAVAWTGEEFLIVGGQPGAEKFGRDGTPETADDGPITEELAGPTEPGEGLEGPPMPAVALDPATGAWRTVAPSPLGPRTRAVTAWTGDEVLVWGGTDRRNGVGGLLDGALYDPASDSWRSVPDAPVGTDRSFGLSAVTDGHVVITAGSTPQSEGEEQLLVLDLADLRWEVVRRPTDDAWHEPVRSIQLLGEGTVAVLRERRSTEDGPTVAAFVVERFDPVTGAVELLASLDDPSDEVPDTFVTASGLLGDAERLLLALTDAENLTHLYVVPEQPPVEPWVAVGSVQQLVAPGSDDGFGYRPQLTVGPAVGAWSHGVYGDLVVIDPTSLEASRLTLTPEGPTCGNAAGHASGDGLLLLVSGDCPGPLLLRVEPSG